MKEKTKHHKDNISAGFHPGIDKKKKKKNQTTPEHLCLYQPAHVPLVFILQHMGQIYHCGCVNDQYLSPYQTRAKWLPWLLRKSRPFIFIYRPLGPIYFNIWGIFTIVGVWMIITYHHTKPEPIGYLFVAEEKQAFYILIQAPGAHILQTMGLIYHCWCVDDQYLSPYQTRAKWLPWLLRRSRNFIFIYRPLGPIYFNIWGIFTIVGVWMIITYHHTKPEPIGCLGC